MVTIRRDALAMLAATAALWPSRAPAAEPAPARRPRNVILILTDDVGWGDLGCYGAKKIRTPNLDRLAAEGLRFTDAHVTEPICSASRYSLLAGEYTFRAAQDPTYKRGISVLGPMSPLVLRTDRPTLASLMKKAGYATGIVGKWHLGLGKPGVGPDYNGEIAPGPIEVGFDSFFGYAATNDRTPCVYIENHRVVGLDPKDPIRMTGNDPEMTNVINNIRRHTRMAGGKAALWKDEEMGEVLTGKACQFIERHRDRPFFLYFATHYIHHPCVPNPRFWNTSEAGPRGDFVQELDWSVGEVMKALDRFGLARDTLVLFSSDNGATIDNQFRTPEWNQKYPADKEKDHPFNGPWRGGKYGAFEGGHRVPLLARWPERIAAGKVSDALISLVDLRATFAAMTGQSLSENDAVDSLDMLPALLDGKPGREWLYSSGSIREGPWKLVAGRKTLYNLGTDPGENTNVHADHPDIAARLQSRLEALKSGSRSRP
jgi:arylsulfatase A-like enzyme